MTQPTIEPNMTLEQAARKAAEIFRWYEQLHAAKPDMEKAKRNAEFAEMLERALTAQAGDGNRLPLEEVPEGWKLAWISHGKFGDAKFCAQIRRVDSHIAPNVCYAYSATPAEALRAAIAAAKDGAG